MTVCLRVRRLALGAFGVQRCLEGAELGGELLVLTLEGLEVEEELGALGAQFLGVRLAGGVLGLELRELRAEAIALEPRLLQRCLQRGWWRR